jgi:hypothetical protein
MVANLERLVNALTEKRFDPAMPQHIGFSVEELECIFKTSSTKIYKPMVFDGLDQVLAILERSSSMDSWFANLADDFYSPLFDGKNFNSS